MGRGNECVFNDSEGLYFVDKDYLMSYRRNGAADDEELKLGCEIDYNEINDYKYDYWESDFLYNQFIEDLCYSITHRFKSFEMCSETHEQGYAILRNSLYSVVISGNEWSYAVKLVKNDDVIGESLENLCGVHFDRYFAGLKESLLEQFEEIGTYTGPWTHGTVKRKVA